MSDERSAPHLGRVDDADLLERGEALRRSGHFDEATECFERHRETDREDIGRQLGALVHLGQLERLSGSPANATRYYEQAVALSSDPTHAEQHAQALIGLGHIERLFGKGGAEASKCFEQALLTARRRRDLNGEAAALRGLGELALQSGLLDESRERFSESRALARATGDALLLATAESGLGRVDLAAGRLDPARDHLAAALAQYRHLQELVGAGDVLQALAGLEVEAVRAQERHQEALVAYQAARDRRGQIYALLDLAKLAERKGQTGKARQLSAEAVACASELGVPRWSLPALCRLSATEWRCGDKEEARQHYQQAVALSEGSHDDLSLGDLAALLEDNNAATRHYVDSKHWSSSIGLASLARAGGNFEQARGHLVEAIAALRRKRVTDTEVSCLLDLADIEETIGNREDCVITLRLAQSLAADMGLMSRQAQALERLGKVAHERDDFTAAERHFREAITLFSQVRDEQGVSCATVHLGDCLLAVGKLDAAEDQFHQAIALANGFGAHRSRGYATRGLAIVHDERGDADSARRLLEEARAIFSAQSDHVGLADVTVDVGYFEEERDKATAAICFREAAELYTKGGRADLSKIPLEEAARLVAPPRRAKVAKRVRAKSPKADSAPTH